MPIGSYLPFLFAPLRPTEPQYLIFFVTDRCNARCSMCFNPTPENVSAQKELTIDEIEKIAKGFKGLIQLTISGGEPFLREDLPLIIRAFVRESGARFVTLSTNAFMTERVLKSTEHILRENPTTMFNFCISVDEVGEKHDSIRGVIGGFERLMETYRGAVRLRERFPNMEIHTTTVLSSANAGRIVEVLEWIDENLDSEVPEVLLVRGSPRDPSSANVDLSIYENAARKIEQMCRKRISGADMKKKLITSLTSMMSDALVRSEREDRMVVKCPAGGKLAVLRSDGTVDPCEILETLVPQGVRPRGLDTFSIGNLRDVDYDIKKVAQSEKARLVRRFIGQKKCHCTFECAIFAGLIFGQKNWFKLSGRFIKDWIGK